MSNTYTFYSFFLVPVEHCHPRSLLFPFLCILPLFFYMLYFPSAFASPLKSILILLTPQQEIDRYDDFTYAFFSSMTAHDFLLDTRPKNEIKLYVDSWLVGIANEQYFVFCVYLCNIAYIHTHTPVYTFSLSPPPPPPSLFNRFSNIICMRGCEYSACILLIGTFRIVKCFINSSINRSCTV